VEDLGLSLRCTHIRRGWGVGVRGRLPALNPCLRVVFQDGTLFPAKKGNNLLHLPIVYQAGARIAQDRLTIVGYFGLVLNHGGERGNGKGMSTKR
jgi:hypothetical protein